jgi:hypothetical protein
MDGKEICLNCRHRSLQQIKSDSSNNLSQGSQRANGKGE